jgi:hypothetical protein
MLQEEIIDVLGPGPAALLGFLLMLGGPIALMVWLGRLLIAGQRGARDGLMWGLGVAAWSSACWLFVGYCGAYVCLPGIYVLMTFGVQSEQWWWRELVVHCVNFSLWPALGWLLFEGREGVRHLLRRRG